MSSEEQEQPEITVDEDWKSRVKAEDAALDEARKAESQEAAEDSAKTKIDPQQIPPANFGELVDMFCTQAMLSLGLVPDPATNKAELQKELAKHFIDLLGVLEEKTQGNLDDREKSMLDSTLHQLRLAYVEAAKKKAGELKMES